MKLRIGTRGSQLALTQTTMVASALSAIDSSLTFEIIEIKTSGDKKQSTPEASQGDKKDWILELELALLAETIDIAVHSGKDIPGNIESGTRCLPILARATPNDIFIGKMKPGRRRLSFSELASEAEIGTSSLRRGAALLHSNPQFHITEMRGNVPTRIRKLDESSTLSGIILAAAGVERLNIMKADEYDILPKSFMLPAMNQGILAVQFRSDDLIVKDIIESISSTDLQSVFFAERACAETLEGDCNSAISIFGYVADCIIYLEGRVYSPNGTQCIQDTATGDKSSFEEIGRRLGKELIAKGAHEIQRLKRQ